MFPIILFLYFEYLQCSLDYNRSTLNCPSSTHEKSWLGFPRTAGKAEFCYHKDGAVWEKGENVHHSCEKKNIIEG